MLDHLEARTLGDRLTNWDLIAAVEAVTKRRQPHDPVVCEYCAHECESRAANSWVVHAVGISRAGVRTQRAIRFRQLQCSRGMGLEGTRADLEPWCRQVLAVSSDQNAIVWVGSTAGDVVMKWSRARDRFANLDASTRLLRTLANNGIPVAPPIATREGFDRVVLSGPAGPLSTTVLPALTGKWLDVDDRTVVLSAGAWLARVHQALRAVSEDVVAMAPQPVNIRIRIGKWLEERDRGLAPEASQRLKALLGELPELIDQPQLVHRDFRAANILTRDSKVVGILDFDDVQVDHRVNDLAQASVYLSTLLTEWGPTIKTARQALREGYESVRPLTPSESQWLEVLVLWQGINAIPDEHDVAGWASAL